MHTICRSYFKTWLFPLAALLVLLGNSGCRSLPESGVKSFAAATTTLKVVVTSVGNTAVQDVADIHDSTPTSKTAAAALSSELKQEWTRRIKVMEALDRYSASLSSLVESGKAGQENAKAFVDSLSGLANAVGVAVPAAPAATAVLKLAERVYGEIAAHLAANEIHKAVEKADPILAGLSGLISEDLLNLRSIAVEKRRTALTQLRASSDLVGQLNSLKNARGTAAKKALDNANPDAAALDNLKKLNDAYAMLSSDPEYLSLRGSEAEVDRVFHGQADLIGQASATVLAWAAAHHELVLGLRQKRAPSLDELNRFANDLYDIYKDYRKARSQL